MRASVIITSRNERTDLEVTATLAAYGSVPPFEIIVVDDCSDDDRWRADGDRLKHIPGLRTYRTPSQLGVAGSRNFGASKASGDLLIFMDSHMRMPDWWLHAIKDASLHNPSSVLCFGTVEFNHRYGGGLYACGAEFTVESDIGFETNWLALNVDRPVEICPCIMGACYAVPRPIWKALGGFNPNFYGWGQDEQDLSLRAWMTGFEVRRCHKLVMAHRWDRTAMSEDDERFSRSWQNTITKEEREKFCVSGDMANHWQPGYNAVVSCYCLPESPDFFRQYQGTLKKRFPDARVWRRFHEQEETLWKYRLDVQHARVRSDKEIERIIGPFLPMLRPGATESELKKGRDSGNTTMERKA